MDIFFVMSFNFICFGGLLRPKARILVLRFPRLPPVLCQWRRKNCSCELCVFVLISRSGRWPFSPLPWSKTVPETLLLVMERRDWGLTFAFLTLSYWGMETVFRPWSYTAAFYLEVCPQFLFLWQVKATSLVDIRGERDLPWYQTSHASVLFHVSKSSSFWIKRQN